jgi:cysteine-rich repeat protein
MFSILRLALRRSPPASPSARTWSFSIALALLASVHPAIVQAQCGSCGNGILEGVEQCDDGNTTPGDGCSGGCTLELPPNCQASTSASYQAAFGSDRFYQAVLARAQGLGFNPALNSTVVCTTPDGVTPIYYALLSTSNPMRVSDPAAVISSRADVLAPMTTVLRRQTGSAETEIVYSNGAFHFDYSGDPGSPTLTVRDGAGNVNNGNSVSTGTPEPTCEEAEGEYVNCMLRGVFDPDHLLDCIGCAVGILGIGTGEPFLVFVGILLTAHECSHCLFDPIVGCSFPEDCRTADCTGGKCRTTVGSGGTAGFDCAEDVPPGALCDMQCEICTPAGCKSTFAPCVACTNGQMSVIPTGIKFAKATRVDTIGSCGCGPSVCSCGASASVELDYFDCSGQLVGLCGSSWGGSASQLSSCPGPAPCDPQTWLAQCWNDIGGCLFPPQGGHLGCGGINFCTTGDDPVGPLPPDGIVDLRTEDEKESDCCTPP